MVPIVIEKKNCCHDVFYVTVKMTYLTAAKLTRHIVNIICIKVCTVEKNIIL
jgi:hypothetical protein